MEEKKLVLSSEDFNKIGYEIYKGLTQYNKDAIFEFNRKFRGKEVESPTFSV